MKIVTSDILVVPTPQRAARNCGLARIDFADGYRGRIELPYLTALQGARAIFENPPRFAVALMALRNSLVAPFGLRAPNRLNRDATDHQMVGIFPLLSASPEEVILGGNDRHLDFRIWVSIEKDKTGCDLTISTLVRFNNFFGKVYLITVMPFHRMLSRHLLRRGLRHIANSSLHTDATRRR